MDSSIWDYSGTLGAPSRPYFVQRVHAVRAVSRGPWLGESRGRRARAGAHHTVRGARGGTGAQHGARGGTWARGASNGGIWR